MGSAKSPSQEIKELKTKALVKDKIRKLVYDSFGEGLEPIYYWLLDFLREDLGYAVEKTYDQFAAAEASGFFGELGVRRTAMEKRAMEIMQTLGVIVKSVLQLLWDLKEFELRLDHYDKLKSKNKEEQEAADNALKAIWLTEVDIKKGRGSINVLTQDLNFVTLRDAFMVVKSVEDVKNLDLNDRVKRVLSYKIKEYLDWRKLSELELRKRYQIEKAWLKSQVNAMELYTRWARPYLIATKKLFPTDIPKVGAEDLVTAFDVMIIDLIIFGKKEINQIETPGKSAKKVFPSKSEAEKKYGEDVFRDDRIYAAIEIEFNFRTTPSKFKGSEAGHYVHRGKTEVSFKPYVFAGKDLETIREKETDEVLQFLEGMTKDSLKALHEDLKKYVEEPITKKEEKIVKEIKLPFVKEIKDIIKPLASISKTIAPKKEAPSKPKTNAWDIKRLKSIAKEEAGKDCWTIYDTYKKSHKMIRW